MKKKIFIIFGVILILISAFQNKIFAYNPVIDGAREYMSDMLEDMQNNGEISQELYEDLQKQANTELTKAEITQQLKENLFFFAVGQYANIAEDVVADSLLSLSDIWDYIFWDNDTQSFGFDDGIGEFIKNGLDPLIYDTPTSSGPVVGNWYEVPHNYNDYFVNSSNVNVYTCIVAQGAYSYILTASYDYNAVFNVGSGQYNGKIYHQVTGHCNQTYNGSYVVGYYSKDATYNSSSPSSMGATAYATRGAALADLFGQNWEAPSGEPVLNGKGIIVNENPVFPSLSPIGALNPNYKIIVINNYNNGYPYPPNKGLDVNYYNYDYNYNVPFWGGQELETLEYPEEIEFPSIEFETIAIDENVDSALESLDGGWIVRFFLVAILLLVLGLIL